MILSFFPQHLFRRKAPQCQVFVWTQGLLISLTCSLAVLQLELGCLPQICTGTESHHSKATENLAALIITPIFPRAEGWWLLWRPSPCSPLYSDFLFHPISLALNSEQISHWSEPWKSGNRKIETCSSTWFWKVGAIPGCHLWSLANFQLGCMKCVYEIIYM